MKRRTLLQAAAGSAAAACLPGAYAQGKDVIRLVSGFAPGGITDALCRILADHLAGELGATVIVETKAGAGGRLAAEHVKNARPDGNTFLVGPDGWAIFPSAMYTPAELRYDLLKDLQPVAQLVSYPLALVVNGQVPARNLAEFADWLKKNPNQANFGTPAPNGQVQYVGWMVGQALGTPLEPIVYKGNAPMLVDLLGGQLPAAVLVAGDAAKHPREKVRMLGVIAEQRWALAPDVPTFKEQGFPIRVDEAWQGMWAPAGTPPAAVARMEAALRTVLGKVEVQQAVASKLTVTPAFVGASAMDKQLRESITHWRDVIRRSGYRATGN
jgi:tripartite-type tricarboxylate transporter receptor subunit TctC